MDMESEGEGEEENESKEEEAMMKLMGFGSFDSTKNKHVAGSCNMSGASVKKAHKYRQYMNRKGGFNRPLDYVAWYSAQCNTSQDFVIRYYKLPSANKRTSYIF